MVHMQEHSIFLSWTYNFFRVGSLEASKSYSSALIICYQLINVTCWHSQDPIISDKFDTPVLLYKAMFSHVVAKFHYQKYDLWGESSNCIREYKSIRKQRNENPLDDLSQITQPCFKYAVFKKQKNTFFKMTVIAF